MAEKPDHREEVLQAMVAPARGAPGNAAGTTALLSVDRNKVNTRHISKPLGPGQRGNRAEEPRRRVEPGRWDPGDPGGQVERLDQRMRRARDDVGLAGPASLQPEGVSPRRVLATVPPTPAPSRLAAGAA